MSDTPTQDVIALVRLLLVENADVAAIVADRVTGPYQPRSGDVTDNFFPSIVLDIVGGNNTANGAIQQPIIHVYCYSRESAGDAYRIFDPVKKALRQARLYHPSISTRGYIRLTEPPQSGFNKVLRAHFARATYRATATALDPT